MLFEFSQANTLSDYKETIYQVFLFAVFILWLLRHFADEALKTLKDIVLKVVEAVKEVYQSLRSQK